MAVRSLSVARRAVSCAVSCVVLVAFTGACGDGDGGGGGDPAAAAGPEQYESLDGSTASLAAFRGKPVVVNFFASWCTPCRLEMPDFERVHVELGDRVHFIGLNLQEGPSSAKAVLADTKVTYAIGLDRDGSVYRGYNAFTMPTTVFLDADGAVVKVHGGSLDAGGFTKLIRDELGVT